MRWIAIIGACASLACTSLACTSESDSGADETSTDDSPDSAVVAIVSPNGAPDFVCSGVVIAPRLVVSAAHCFAGGNYDKAGWSFEAVIGADAHDPKARHVALTPHTHPDWQSATSRADFSDADVAVAVASGDLRVATKRWSKKAPPASLVDGRARYAGFGAHVTAEKGRRHFIDAKIVAVRSDVVAMEADPSPCHGDSGGPLLADVDGVETVLGVGHVAQSDGGEGCTKGADYTRLDLFTDFIGSF